MPPQYDLQPRREGTAPALVTLAGLVRARGDELTTAHVKAHTGHTLNEGADLVVDAHLGQGNVLLFGNNPIYRGETIGDYGMVFNAILNHDHLVRTATAEEKPVAEKSDEDK